MPASSRRQLVGRLVAEGLKLADAPCQKVVARGASTPHPAHLDCHRDGAGPLPQTAPQINAS
eukprot:8839270-Lingulodinium_polyedra.AAC.1